MLMGRKQILSTFLANLIMPYSRVSVATLIKPDGICFVCFQISFYFCLNSISVFVLIYCNCVFVR